MLSINAGKRKRQKKKAVSLPKNHTDNSDEIKKFKDYYDDSSDEETVEKRNETYNISNAWQKKLADEEDVAENEFLSFVAHSAGLQVLYSSDVNQIYYPLKTSSFKNITDGTHQIQTLIQAAVMQTIRKACMAVKTFVFIANQKDKHFADPEKLSSLINFKCQPELTALIDKYLIDFIHAIKSSKSTSRIQLDDCQGFQSDLEDLLLKTFKFYCKSYPNSDTDEPHSGSRNDNVPHSEFKELCKSKMLYVIKHLKIVEINSAGKLHALECLNSYEGDYPCIVRTIKKRLNHCRAVGSVESMLVKEFEKDKTWQDELMMAYQEDVAMQIKNKVGFSSSEKTIIHRHCMLSRNNLVNLFESCLHIFLQHKISTALDYFYRPNLGKAHHFFSHDSYSFYANLRLSNRSQKRQALNMKHGIFKQDSVMRSWGFFPTVDNQTAAVELQQITGKNLSRKDLVTDLGSYDKMNDVLDQIREYFLEKNSPITDKEIALWIRQIFHGQEPELADNTIDQYLLVNKLESIAYLLFGCEAARNPSMIVINQMFLDLIIEHPDYNFVQLFLADGDNKINRMPMAPKGAVAVARALESHYRNYLPHPYFYSGVEDDKDKPEGFTKTDLINAEANIVKNWLKMKFGRTIKLAVANQDANKILKLIQSSYDQWFRKQDQNLSKKILTSS